MSHIVTIQVEVKDLDAIKSACRRLNLKEPVHGKAVVFETEIEGILVELPDWIYPIVCILDTGELKYDYTGSTCREASRFLEDALGVGYRRTPQNRVFS